jgi:hypothetical protein
VDLVIQDNELPLTSFQARADADFGLIVCASRARKRGSHSKGTDGRPQRAAGFIAIDSFLCLRVPFCGSALFVMPHTNDT